MQLLPEVRMANQPDRILVLVDPDDNLDTGTLSLQALQNARDIMPKVTGQAAVSLELLSGPGHFGIYFPDRRVWFIEQGTRPHTMRSLAGKTIPMWIDDPTGAERKANPKAKVRRTIDNRTQVLIFRKVGIKGASRKTNGARYPGQPGRIARREAAKPLTATGRQGGRIAKGNVGVAWRNPGITGRSFLNVAVTMVAWDAGINPDKCYLVDSTTLYTLLRNS